VIPAFAVGRAQQMIYLMDKLVTERRMRAFPVHLDSPMAIEATRIYSQFPDALRPEMAGLAGRSILYNKWVQLHRTRSESEKLNEVRGPAVILSSSGMLTGGRVLHHLKDIVEDPAGTLLFVGYQGQGTLGAHLQAGAREIKLDGQVHQVRCRVVSISGFSAHADESELLDWVGNFKRGTRRPKRVFIVHGDPPAEAALEPKVRALGFDVHIPTWRETVTLD
jgi:metallo-beta-lactamase family protein